MTIIKFKSRVTIAWNNQLERVSNNGISFAPPLNVQCFTEDSEAQIDREIGLKADLNRFSLLGYRLQMLNVQI